MLLLLLPLGEVVDRDAGVGDSFGGELSVAASRFARLVLEAAAAVRLADPTRAALRIFEAVERIGPLTAGEQEKSRRESYAQTPTHAFNVTDIDPMGSKELLHADSR